MSLSDISAIVRWWLIVEIIGLLALPLAFRVLRWLPGRGYALVKPLGLLLAGYLLWILSSFGFLRRNAGGAVFALVLLGVRSAVVYI